MPRPRGATCIKNAHKTISNRPRSNTKRIMEGIRRSDLMSAHGEPWEACVCPNLNVNVAFQEVKLSEKVHHWTPDGSYGSKDFKFPINVPMNLSSFDVRSLIASIFGKLKFPSNAPFFLLDFLTHQNNFPTITL